MSSDLSELDSILGIPGASMSSISMADDNLFNQHNFSLSNALDHSRITNDEIAKMVEQAIEIKFCKIEDSLIEAIRKEHAALHKLFHLNTAKTDGFADQFSYQNTIRGNYDIKENNKNNFDCSLAENNSQKTNSMIVEGSNVNMDVKTGATLEKKQNGIDQRLDSIFERIQQSSKKLEQDLLDLDTNVDQRVEGLETKINSIFDVLGRLEKMNLNAAAERNEMVTKIALLHESLTNMSNNINHMSPMAIDNGKNVVSRKLSSNNETAVLAKDSMNNSSPSRCMESDETRLDSHVKNVVSNDNSNECINQLLINTTSLLQKTSKLQNSVDEIHENVLSTSSKDSKLRRSIDNINNHIEELQTLSKSSVKSSFRSKNIKKTVNNCDIKKKIFSDTSSSSSSDESDDSSNGDTRTKSTSSVDRQLGKINSGIEEIKEKMNSWLRYSKKAIKNSDENTNVMLERFLSVNKSIQNSTSENKSVHTELLKKIKDVSSNTCPSPSMHDDKLRDLDEKITKMIGNMNETLNETKSYSLAIKSETSQDTLSDKAINAINDKLEEVKSTAYHFSDSKLDKHLQLIQDVRTKSHDLFNNIIPSLDNICQMQNQELKRRENENIRLTERLDKIVDLVETSKEPILNDSNFMMQILKAINEIKSQDGDKILKTFNDMLAKNMIEVKFENSKILARLNEVLKGKSSEKMLQRVCKLVEESKANENSNTKTLSTINSSVQALKASNTKLLGQMKESKAKVSKNEESTKSNLLTKDLYHSSVEGLKQVINEKFIELKDNVSEINESQIDTIANMHHRLREEDFQKLVLAVKKPEASNNSELSENLKASFEETNLNLLDTIESIDSKIQTIEDELGRNQKEVIERLNGAFTDIKQKPNISVIEKALTDGQNSLEERLMSNYLKHGVKLFDEISKQNGLQSEILNSIEDLKQLTSSTPNTIHDLFPLVEKLGNDIIKIPDEVGSYMAGLEENLCVNLESKVKGIHKNSLQALYNRFDTIEQRMAVIRKYVKYQNLTPTPSTQDENTSTTNGTLNSSTAEQIEKLANSQIECLDILKILPPFGKIKEKTSPRKYQTTAKCIFELLGCLRRAEMVQRNMDSERKRDKDLHDSTKEGLLNVLPSLENIVLVMKQFKKQRSFNITLLNELCNELNESIDAIKSVNLSLPALKHVASHEGIVELVRNGMNILDKLVANVFSCVERPSLNYHRRRLPYLGRNIKPGAYQSRKKRKRSSHLHSSSGNGDQSELQSQSSINIGKLEGFNQGELENDPSCVLSYEKFSDNQIMPSPAQDGSQRMSKRSRNLSSSSDGTVDDDLSQKTGTASISSRSTTYATLHTNDIKSPAFLPPNSDHLSQYRLKQMAQSSPLQSMSISRNWKHEKSKNFSNTLSRFSENTSDIQEANSEIIDDGETPDTSTNSVSIYHRNDMMQQSTVSTNKRSQEPSLLNISRKRLKMSKSLASPRSSISTTSTISLPNSTHQQLKNNKKR